MIRAMSPAEKLRVAQQLRRTAWALTAAGVRQRHPTWTVEEIEQEVRAVFLRVQS
jgi:hypothetical protein